MLKAVVLFAATSLGLAACTTLPDPGTPPDGEAAAAMTDDPSLSRHPTGASRETIAQHPDGWRVEFAQLRQANGTMLPYCVASRDYAPGLGLALHRRRGDHLALLIEAPNARFGEGQTTVKLAVDRQAATPVNVLGLNPQLAAASIPNAQQNDMLDRLAVGVTLTVANGAGRFAEFPLKGSGKAIAALNDCAATRLR